MEGDRPGTTPGTPMPKETTAEQVWGVRRQDHPEERKGDEGRSWLCRPPGQRVGRVPGPGLRLEKERPWTRARLTGEVLWACPRGEGGPVSPAIRPSRSPPWALSPVHSWAKGWSHLQPLPCLNLCGFKVSFLEGGSSALGAHGQALSRLIVLVL